MYGMILINDFLFFEYTATTRIYTRSLHDALPISVKQFMISLVLVLGVTGTVLAQGKGVDKQSERVRDGSTRTPGVNGSKTRSEEHTSELQSHLNLVCRLLLEKKKGRKAHEELVLA